MKAIFLRFKKRHIWLLCALALNAAFLLLRGDRSLMNAFAAHVTVPLRQVVSAVTYAVRFSVMELLIALGVAAAVVYIVLTAVRLCRRPEKGRTLYGFVLTALCIAATLYAGSSLLWGVFYYTDSFQQQSGIYAEEVSKEELYAVTVYFARQLSKTADGVPRDDSGLFAVPREEILADAPEAYGAISREIPCLAGTDRVPKAMLFSDVMSLLDFTGVYCPYTAESNVNVASPACMLPATIAHELAHQKGIASEKECNFTAVLASTTCASPAYRYSGWLLGYIHLSNALYRTDKDLWQTVRNTLPEEVRADIADNNAYWAAYRDNPVTNAYQDLYDRYLKGYGESAGVQSYGMVVDLLAVYYRDAARLELS